MRRLTVSFHVTVANYEYLAYWRLYQDGNIECEVRATGIMVTTHFAEGRQPPYGTLVDERTYAPFHQHFLVARLDLDVDGERNVLSEVASRGDPPGPANPHGQAFTVHETPPLQYTVTLGGSRSTSTPPPLAEHQRPRPADRPRRDRALR